MDTNKLIHVFEKLTPHQGEIFKLIGEGKTAGKLRMNLIFPNERYKTTATE